MAKVEPKSYSPKSQMDFYQGRLAYAKYLFKTNPAEFKIYMNQFTERERGRLEADLREFRKTLKKT